MAQELPTDLILYAYSIGTFPMADGRNSQKIHWVEPRFRGIFPMDRFHISRSLSRKIHQRPFRVTLNTAFSSVIRACADRDETWINQTIEDSYTRLHREGHAHSIEIWNEAELVGGVYGIAMGGAFFGESMFSTRTDASKIALAYLIHRLKSTGFQLFDTQFITPHLASLGAIEIPKGKYKMLLSAALKHNARIDYHAYCEDVALIAQRNTQTS